MKQLSGSDTLFLRGEHGNVYNHIAMLMIYDVSTAPQGVVRFKDILQHFEAKLYEHSIFRRRLVTPPLGLDRPYWVEDKSIDTEFHLRHIALPKPGDWRQLMIQAARLHSRPLDRSRPLWEAYIIEGLDNIPKLPPGSFAMLLKLHHSAVNDMAGVQLVQQLHSTQPRLSRGDGSPQMVVLENPPLPFQLISKAVSNIATRSKQIAGLGYRTANMGTALVKEQMEKLAGGRDDTLTLPHPPHTRFNNPVSANRVMEGFGMPHSRIATVRSKLPGVSAHDVIVATVGGGLQRYFSRRKELGEKSLVAYMPMEMGTAQGMENSTAQPALIHVHNDIADPVERLIAVSQDSSKAQLDTEAMGSALLQNVLDVAPSFLSNFIISKLFSRNYNLSLSTVNGPESEVYLAGAKAMCLYSFGIPVDGAGLVVSGVNYNRVTWLSMVSCRDMLPDPGVFLQCMQESWNQILAAAQALPVPLTPPQKRTPAKKRGAHSTKTSSRWIGKKNAA